MQNSPEPLISFIVPVHNTARWLQACLSSALSLEERNIEIVVIDDGSTDGSLEVAKQAARRDGRIRVTAQQRSGASSARNRGLDLAAGRYLSFLDSDDLIVPKGISELLAVAEANGSDITAGIVESFSWRARWVLPVWASLKTISAINTTAAATPVLQVDSHCGGKLFRASFVRRVGTQFLTGCQFSQDAYFVLALTQRAGRISRLPVVSYRYRSHGAADRSISSQISPRAVLDPLHISSLIDEECRESDTPVARALRHQKFLHSSLYHLRRLLRSSPSQAESSEALEAMRRFTCHMSESASEGLTPNDSLACELIRVGRIAEGAQLLAHPCSPQMRHSLLESLERTDGASSWMVARIRRDAQLGIGGFPRRRAWDWAAKVNHTARTATMAAITQAKMVFAALLSMVLPRHSPVWLIGERGGEGMEDNGFALFAWLADNRSDVNPRFVTKKRNLSRLPARLRPDAIAYGSLQHFRLLFRARVAIFTDSTNDIAPFWRLLLFRNHLRRRICAVFLSHGVSALKGPGGYYHRAEMEARHEWADLITASSEQERLLLTGGLGHPPENVVITGLARFDLLPPAQGASNGARRILFVPTWRSALDQRGLEAALFSRFYHEVISLLRSPSLRDLLERHDATLEVVLHHRLAFLTPLFAAAACRTISVSNMRSSPIPDKIIGCDLLITDYSSVAFDAAYMGKPVLLFQFDRDEFFGGKAAWQSTRDLSLPGPVLTSPEDLVLEISRTAERGWRADEPFEACAETLFSFRDSGSCARTCAAIGKLLSVMTF